MHFGKKAKLVSVDLERSSHSPSLCLFSVTTYLFALTVYYFFLDMQYKICACGTYVYHVCTCMRVILGAGVT